MKRLVILGMLAFAVMVKAQSTPSLVGLMNSSDGVNWTNVTTTSTTAAYPPTYTPSLVGILCYNTTSHQWVPTGCPPGGGTGTITSPNGTITVGGTSGATTVVVNPDLVLHSLAFTTDDVGITFHDGSTINSDPTFGLNLNSTKIFLCTSGPCLTFSDSINSRYPLSQLSGITGGSALGAAMEVFDGVMTGYVIGTGLAENGGSGGPMLTPANTLELQLGIGATTGGGTNAAVFAPGFSIGDHTVFVKGAVSYSPVTFSPGATVNLTTDVLQTYTLSANTTASAPTIYKGERVIIQICQPGAGGPWTWTWPAAIHGGMTIGATASTCSQQAFDSFSGTTLVAENTGVLNVAP